MIVMDRNTEPTSVNQQDHPHNEGQQQNIAPAGQPNAHNNSQSMNNMLQESDEQKASRPQGGKTEEDVQDEQRLP